MLKVLQKRCFGRVFQGVSLEIMYHNQASEFAVAISKLMTKDHQAIDQ